MNAEVLPLYYVYTCVRLHLAALVSYSTGGFGQLEVKRVTQQTWSRHVTCSSSLLCRSRACSASQLDVVEPVPKPVPLAQ